ncbi:hypothetical protein [Microbulbifer spongiae]|uniref:Uncharacterized protein n=1 Tax=Microbulbifer spongiae TaxID=2944933 RepID=A0ABY9E9U3_9GAMM|nr:hypothetical protein [Microbulbifer sp. MI-G]WKD49225.1 hypothetical protein M8T91_15175 [Microbulbifer sp. MI-G]
MTKKHRNHLHIINNTVSTFKFKSAYLEHGQLANGAEWPQEIAANGGELTVECHEIEASAAGCSGWVSYTGDSPESPINLYFLFSNPVYDSNKVDVGISEHTYHTMESQLLPVQRVFPMAGSTEDYIIVSVSNADGEVSIIQWIIDNFGNEVIPANPLLLDAEAVFSGVNGGGGVRTYYDADEHSAYSHFKGVAAFKRKLIFTHTNVARGSDKQGIYLIGDKVKSAGGVGKIQASYHTEHTPPWGHPGGAQVCGSYMALTLEKTDHDNHSSEVQIYDARPTAFNEQMRLITTIKQDWGVNGGGMTKELGDEGCYVVIAADDSGLSVYRSNSSSLSEETKFKLIQLIKKNNLPNSFNTGSGLALATQTDGKLFIFTMHGSEGEDNNTLSLYQLIVTGNSASVEQVGTTKAMDLPNSDHVISALNTSFRWGKGLDITSPTSIEVFATDRNILPSPIDKKNFGVVTWQGEAASVASVNWGGDHYYDTGSNLAIAMDDSHCVEMHRGSGGNSNKLYHKVGNVNFSKQEIDWGKSIYYHSGSDFGIAMDNNGNCVEVHRGGGSSTTHYYAVGKVNFSKKTIDWGESEAYGVGSNLAIAMDNRGFCLEVHRASDGGQTLLYRLGKIHFDEKTILWTTSISYGKGSDVAIATDNLGNYVEIHRGVDGTENSNEHYYRVGKISPLGHVAIDWGDVHWYDTGSVLSIAMNNNGNCIEVHRGSNDRNTLYYRVGKVDFNKKTIEWSKSAPYVKGSDLCVAMDSRGHCIELHRHEEGSEGSDKQFYRMGVFFG